MSPMMPPGMPMMPPPMSVGPPMGMDAGMPCPCCGQPMPMPMNMGSAPNTPVPPQMLQDPNAMNSMLGALMGR